ncbi:hypothetical protein EWM64_g161 [Hericium alpestre]|uniref:VWFA domain-containing protein n=1 Tax=Hericium alpestre TaxID=135208 RepID=A0A4Z0AD64_9AGAM|nr:hypothetical protein EWM64_g161 [Hericium alpestre]
MNLSGGQRPNTNAPIGTQRLSLIKTVVIVDDSMSMAGQPWNDAREALAGVAELAGQVDSEGLDIYFLNDSRFRLDIRDRQAMRSLFDLIMPGGVTPTGKKLKEVLDIYIPKLENRRLAQKPISIIVITDGVPTDDPKEAIVQAALRLDMANVPARQLGIQFVQIGDDPGATEALNQLDDGLASMSGLRDMVDTTTFNPNDPLFRTESLVKILLGAVDNALDNTGVGISPSMPKVGGPAWGSNYGY